MIIAQRNATFNVFNLQRLNFLVCIKEYNQISTSIPTLTAHAAQRQRNEGASQNAGDSSCHRSSKDRMPVGISPLLPAGVWNYGGDFVKRGQGYYRYQRKRHIKRKMGILRRIGGEDNLACWTGDGCYGVLSKGKIHCSCWMCRTKSYDDWSHSDQQMFLLGDLQVKEASYEAPRSSRDEKSVDSGYSNADMMR